MVVTVKKKYQAIICKIVWIERTKVQKSLQITSEHSELILYFFLLPLQRWMRFHWVQSHVEINKSLTLAIRCHCSWKSYFDISLCALISSNRLLCLSCYTGLISDRVWTSNILYVLSGHFIKYVYLVPFHLSGTLTHIYHIGVTIAHLVPCDELASHTGCISASWPVFLG